MRENKGLSRIVIMTYVIAFDNQSKKVQAGFVKLVRTRYRLFNFQFSIYTNKRNMTLDEFKEIFVGDITFLTVHSDTVINIHSATTYVVENYPELYL